jgi:alkylation response protein AidB-like acyl-CoA dehydrogenase
MTVGAMVLWLLAAGAASAQDAEGCKDHPLFTRFPKMHITDCEASQFDMRTFPVGPIDKDQATKSVEVEGAVTWINYQVDEGTTPPSGLQLMRNFELERIMAAANELGQAEYAFELAATHAASRVQFGQVIGNFQQIQMYLTDMAIAIENMRNLVFTAAQMLDEGVPLKTYGAMTKRYVARETFTVCDLALQIHGGLGFANGAPIARLWRDARGVRIGGGTDEVMVHIIGRQIIKDHQH